jgi:hypothetical protein
MIKAPTVCVDVCGGIALRATIESWSRTAAGPAMVLFGVETPCGHDQFMALGYIQIPARWLIALIRVTVWVERSSS